MAIISTTSTNCIIDYLFCTPKAEKVTMSLFVSDK